MTYTPIFHAATLDAQRGRRPDGAVSYLYDPALELAVNVALASGRPLLLSGAPGTGKSTLAADVAWKLGRRYHDAVITSRTTAQDLQWSFDTVRRLALASAGKDVDDVRPFVQPGPLWRAFEPATAARHGAAPRRPGGRGRTRASTRSCSSTRSTRPSPTCPTICWSRSISASSPCARPARR